MNTHAAVAVEAGKPLEIMLKLEEVDGGFELMHKGGSIRPVVEF